jgi:hypothetical protein
LAPSMVMKVYRNKPSMRMTFRIEIQNSERRHGAQSVTGERTDLAVNPGTETVGKN